MKPVEKIYWLRLGLGITAALVCTAFGWATGVISPDASLYLNKFMNGLSLALIVYLISYYIIKAKFLAKVEKPQKLLTMGIGIYFISWIVFWILFYSILAGPPPAPQ